MMNPYEQIKIKEHDLEHYPNVSVFIGNKVVWVTFDPIQKNVEVEVSDIATNEVHFLRKYGDSNVQDE